MKKYNKFIVLMLAIVLCFSLMCTGCSNNTETSASGDEPEKITVVDGLGREITLEKTPERILTSYGIATQMVFTLGAQDRLVGIDSPSLTNKFLISLDPDIPNMATPGSPAEFNVEEGIALNPDIILVPGRNQQLVETLEEKGLNVFGVVAEDLDQLKNTVLELGKALGQEEQAENFVKYYDNVIKEVEEKTASLSDGDKPTVYLAGPMGLLSTCSQDMYQNDLITLAGGKNAAGELTGGWVDISPEQLIEWNPDVIVIVQYTTNITPEDVLTDSRYQGINAVKNKQVFWFPSNLSPWDYPSPEAAVGILWTAQKLQPDLFPDLDMIDEADNYFETFYGKTFTELGGSLTSREYVEKS